MPSVAILDANAYINLEGGDEPVESIAKLSQLALQAHLSLYVTPELEQELSRDKDEKRRHRQTAHTKKFPTVPVSENPAIRQMVSSLDVLMFSNRRSKKRQANRLSDCRQLAYAIEFGAAYFVTADSDFLKHGEVVWDRYGVRVITPDELVKSIQAQISGSQDEPQTLAPPNLLIRQGTKADLGEIRGILAELAHDYPGFLDDWLPKQFGKAVIKVAVVQSEIGAVSITKDKGAGVVKLATFFVAPECRRRGVGQHLLQHEIVNWSRSRVGRVVVTVPLRKQEMIRFFWERGFRVEGISPNRYQRGPEVVMGRQLINKTVKAIDWPDFAQSFLTNTLACQRIEDDPQSLWVASVPPERWAFPLSVRPFRAEFISPGGEPQIALRSADSNHPFELWDASRLERAFFPLIVAWPTRTATIIPIREAYAQCLFQYAEQQGRLFEDVGRTRLRANNVYYRAGNRQGDIQRGTHILFYVSDPVKKIVAIARATRVEIGKADFLYERYSPLGVLGLSDVRAAASSTKGKAQAICFDYLEPLPKPVPYRKLEEVCHNVNVVTAFGIPFDQYLSLRKLGGLSGD